MSEALPCAVCGKTLEGALPDRLDVTNHPSDALVFVAYGQYGSTVFDPMDGRYLEINVCDGCVRRLAEKKRVLLGRASKPVVVYGLIEGLDGIPSVVGRVRVDEDLIPWHGGLEDEGEKEYLVLGRDEMGSDRYPEVEYSPGILEAYAPVTDEQG